MGSSNTTTGGAATLSSSDSIHLVSVSKKGCADPLQRSVQCGQRFGVLVERPNQVV